MGEAMWAAGWGDHVSWLPGHVSAPSGNQAGCNLLGPCLRATYLGLSTATWAL